MPIGGNVVKSRRIPSFRSLRKTRRSPSGRRSDRFRRLHVESLEDRRVLAPALDISFEAMMKYVELVRGFRVA